MQCFDKKPTDIINIRHRGVALERTLEELGLDKTRQLERGRRSGRFFVPMGSAGGAKFRPSEVGCSQLPWLS